MQKKKEKTKILSDLKVLIEIYVDDFPWWISS